LPAFCPIGNPASLKKVLNYFSLRKTIKEIHDNLNESTKLKEADLGLKKALNRDVGFL
jgi:hypothetical protein